VEGHPSWADVPVGGYILPLEGSSFFTLRARPAWGIALCPGHPGRIVVGARLDKFFYPILKGLTLLGGMSTVLVVPALLPAVGIFWA